MKFRNCTQTIKTLNATELKTKILDDYVDCIDFFKNCAKSEENQFNTWKVMFKTLSMSAGELGFDDLPDANFISVLTVALFTILVLFVIMNLMTSVAVYDIGEIRNISRDAGWYRLMLLLNWYDALLPECCIREQEPREDENVIIIKKNEATYCSFKEPSSYFNFLVAMPLMTNE